MKQLLLVLSFMISFSAFSSAQALVFLDNEQASEQLTYKAKEMHDLDRANPVHTVHVVGHTAPTTGPSDDYAYFEFVLNAYIQKIQESGNTASTFESYFSSAFFQQSRLTAEQVEEARSLVYGLITREQ